MANDHDKFTCACDKCNVAYNLYHGRPANFGLKKKKKKIEKYRVVWNAGDEITEQEFTNKRKAEQYAKTVFGRVEKLVKKKIKYTIEVWEVAE